MFSKQIRVFDYGLHDSQISSVNIENNCLYLKFDSGVYILDSAGKEQNKTKTCSMRIEIEHYVNPSFDSNLEIQKFYKGKIVEIGIKRFLKAVNKYGFRINNHFYSSFNDVLLIKGFLGYGYGMYEILISDIKTLSFIDI